MIDISVLHQGVIHKILQRHVPCCEVRVFGSRIGPKAKKYSDLDLVIIGEAKIPSYVLAALKEDFQESDLPFRVDVLDWHVVSEEFRVVIDKKYEILQKSAA